MRSPDAIKVISADVDGAQLNRNRRDYFIRCNGKGDNGPIQEAINRVGKTTIFLKSEDWKRIFGRTK